MNLRELWVRSYRKKKLRYVVRDSVLVLGKSDDRDDAALRLTHVCVYTYY